MTLRGRNRSLIENICPEAPRLDRDSLSSCRNISNTRQNGSAKKCMFFYGSVKSCHTVPGLSKIRQNFNLREDEFTFP